MFPGQRIAETPKDEAERRRREEEAARDDDVSYMLEEQERLPAGHPRRRMIEQWLQSAGVEKAGPPTDRIVGGPIPQASVGAPSVPTASKPDTNAPPPPPPSEEKKEEERGSRITAVRTADGKIRFITENLAGEYAAGREAMPEYGLAARAPAEVLGREAGVAAFMQGAGKNIPAEAEALSRLATAQRLREANEQAARDPRDVIEAAPYREAFDQDRERRALEYAKIDQEMLGAQRDPREREAAELDILAARARLAEAEAGRTGAETGLIEAKTGDVTDPVGAARKQGQASVAETAAVEEERRKAGERFVQTPRGQLEVDLEFESLRKSNPKAVRDPALIQKLRELAVESVIRRYAEGKLVGIGVEQAKARAGYFPDSGGT